MAERSTHTHDFVLLDGFRGLGAILIVIGHSMMFWGPLPISSGAVLVDAFFMLSGFVIAYAYESRRGAGFGVAEFMTWRVVRLFPLYVLGVVVGFCVLVLTLLNNADGGDGFAKAFVNLGPNLFMLPAPLHDGNIMLYPLNPPAWTLFFEMLVNLVYIAAFRWLRSTRVLALLVLLLAALLAVLVIRDGDINEGVDWSGPGIAAARAGFGFFAGVLTYRLVRKSGNGKRPTSRWTLVALVGIPVLCMAPATPELRPFVDLFLILALGIPLLWLSQRADPPKQFTRLFLFGGKISYAIYILHWPMMEILIRLNWYEPSIGAAAPLPGIALLVAAIVAAWWTEKYYDRPVRQWVMGRLKAGAARRAEMNAASATAD